MIARHRDVSNGYFSSNLKNTGLENANDSESNTYCIIGALDVSDYMFDEGKYYEFKLIYFYSDGTNDTLIWTQTSWITEETITGANLSKIEESASIGDGVRFRGLGLSTHSNTYLDGSGGHHYYWYLMSSSLFFCIFCLFVFRLFSP